MSNAQSKLKRFTDVVLASLGLVVAAPILLISAIAIKLDSPGPVFFLQERSGKGGKPFKIIKLRTMVSNASRIGPVLTQRSDSRITKVGHLLRRTSFDELPQIFNVLKGEMSIVGPRPEVPAITNTYDPYMKQVLDYKPGITGISQINGRAELEIEDKVKMEIAYQKKATLASDMKVILKTPLVLVTNKGNVM